MPALSTMAPSRSNMSTISVCPFLDAQIKGVVPYCSKEHTIDFKILEVIGKCRTQHIENNFTFIGRSFTIAASIYQSTTIHSAPSQTIEKLNHNKILNAITASMNIFYRKEQHLCSCAKSFRWNTNIKWHWAIGTLMETVPRSSRGAVGQPSHSTLGHG